MFLNINTEKKNNLGEEYVYVSIYLYIDINIVANIYFENMNSI